MNTTKKHRGYIGSIECDIEDNTIYGKVLYINDLIVYEAETLEGLQSAFVEAVNDYLDTCIELEKDPDKPFNGSTNIRIGSQRHREVTIKAAQEGINFNQAVISAIDLYLKATEVTHNHYHHVITARQGKFQPVDFTSGQLQDSDSYRFSSLEPGTYGTARNSH